MTTMTTNNPQALWATMPGWGIVADLTPPEVLASRRLATIRRYSVVALVTVLMLGALGFAGALYKKHVASNALTKEQTRTSTLLAEENQFANVIQIQGTVQSVQAKVATLLRQDVELADTLAAIQEKLPAGATLSQLNLTIQSAASVAAAGVGANVGGNLYTGTQHQIGVITVGGNAPTMPAVAQYVDALTTIKGIVEPYPTTNTAGSSGVQYLITMSITDALYTHRYDIKTGN